METSFSTNQVNRGDNNYGQEVVCNPHDPSFSEIVPLLYNKGSLGSVKVHLP